VFNKSWAEKLGQAAPDEDATQSGKTDVPDRPHSTTTTKAADLAKEVET
jgi:hypothetical protein